MVECSTCESTFLTRSSLNLHRRTAKYCLKLQTEIEQDIQEFKCDLCCKVFTQKVTLKSHKCIPKMVTYKMFKEAMDMYHVKCDEIEDLKRLNAGLRAKYELSEDHYNQQRTLVEKLASRPTYVTNINKQINSLEPLTDKAIEDSMDDLSLDILQGGGRFLGQWAGNGILKNKAICTDTSRKNFVWKTEDGNPFRDIKGSGLAKKFFTYIHDVKGEELKEWISTTNAKLEKLEKDGFSIDGEILRNKLNRVCSVKLECHNSSKGEHTNLSREFVEQISMLLVKDTQEFIDTVVDELLAEEENGKSIGYESGSGSDCESD